MTDTPRLTAARRRAMQRRGEPIPEPPPVPRRPRRRKRPRGLTHLAFALIVLAIFAVQAFRFSGLAYSLDEAWDVHAALDATSIAEMVAAAPDGEPFGWQVLLYGWLTYFGHTEATTRFLSVLLLLPGLAFLYRLGADLFDRPTGFMTLIVLGLLTAFHLFGHEAQPYALLLTAVTAMVLSFTRWLWTRRFVYALLFLLSGALAVNTHTTALLLLPAFLVVTALLVRPGWGAYVVALLLVALVGVSAVVWALPLSLDANPSGGPVTWERLVNLSVVLNLSPPLLGYFLVLLGLVAMPPPPPDAALRPRDWNKWLVIALTLTGVTAYLIITAIDGVVARRALFLLPLLVLWAAMGLSYVTWRVQVAVAVVAFTGLWTILPFSTYADYLPHDEVAAVVDAGYQPGDSIVIAAFRGVEQIAPTYYLTERLATPPPDDRVYHIVRPLEWRDFNAPADVTRYVTTALNDETFAAFDTFLDATDRLWYVQRRDHELFAEFRPLIEAGFAPLNVWEFESYTVVEYSRNMPREYELIFGDNVVLNEWSLTNADGAIFRTIAPCETVTFTSVWQTREPLSQDYELIVAFRGSDGRFIGRSDTQLTDQPATAWQINEAYTDTITGEIACGTPPGDYDVLLSVHDGTDALPVTRADGQPSDPAAVITTLTVSAE